jgi:hypothetical protein
MASDYENNPKLTPILVSCLQEWGIESLTYIQRLAVDAEVPLGSSAIVCAPTSSGKTLIGELALANALSSGFDALYLVSQFSRIILSFSMKSSTRQRRLSIGCWKIDSLKKAIRRFCQRRWASPLHCLDCCLRPPSNSSNFSRRTPNQCRKTSARMRLR